MDVTSAIMSSYMEMQTTQFAAEYSTGVMAMEMDQMEAISQQLIAQMMQLDVGAADSHMLDVLA